jgi:hypothetical protein
MIWRASIFALVFSLATSKLCGQLNENGDFQVWSFLSVENRFAKTWHSRLWGVARWGDDASQLYFTYAQGQIVYTKNWFEVAPGYRQEYHISANQWEPVYAPLCDIFFTLIGKWEIEDRNRIIYHMPKNAEKHWSYRNRIRLLSPAIPSFFSIKLFLDNEFFFREKVGFNQNRLSIGVLGTPLSFLNVRVNYMYRSLKSSEVWIHHNVAVAHFHFDF